MFKIVCRVQIKVVLSFPFFPSIGVAYVCVYGRTILGHWQLMEERVWTKHYYSVHFTTNIGDVKLSTNVVYGRNGLRVKHGADSPKSFNHFNTMLDIKAMLKTLKIIMHIVLKCILKSVTAKKVISSGMSSFSNH